MNLTTTLLQEQANVARRAETLYEDGYTLIVNDAPAAGPTYLITSPEGHTYEFDTLTKRCNCPYFVKRNAEILAVDPFAEKIPCKHGLGAEELKTKCEAAACEMDVESYLRWKESEEAI
jgi:hypothetical protein